MIRYKAAGWLALLGMLCWLPATSLALCALIRTISVTSPWVLPIAAFFYWRDFGDAPVVTHWLPLAAGGSAVAVLAPAFFVLCWPRRTGQLRAAGSGEKIRPVTRAASDSHGNADWLPMDQVRKIFPGRHPAYGGVVVGEAYRVDKDPGAKGRFDAADPKTWGQGGKAELLIDPCTSDATHGTVFAGSGGYKTTSITLPTLATWTGSAVVFDPPNQVAPMVRDMREGFGHKVWVIKPGGASIDVLGWIDPAEPLAETEVANVLTWLCGDVDEKAKGENSTFAEAGRMLLECILADMLWDPNLLRSAKTLHHFRERVTIPEKFMQGRLEDIAEASHSPMARDYARTLMKLYAKTFSGVYFNAITATKVLAFAGYAAMLSRADFDPADICNGKVTVFISVPMKDLEAYPALGRVLVGTFQNALRRAEGKVASGRVLFLLDEARFLRRLSILADMMTADRKYGATIVTMWQSQTDLKAIWKENAGVFQANSSWTMYAAVEDEATQRAISVNAGRYTGLNRNEGASSSSGGMMSTTSNSYGTSSGQSEQGYDLIRPEQVRLLRADEAIIFRRGARPIRCGRAIYFRRADMRARIGADRMRSSA